MTETVACAVERFVAHKRAHGRKYHSEARQLALLVRFAAGHDVSCLSELTPALLEDFLASRPRSHPRSFNHLLGVVRGLLDWAVTWQLLEASPLQARRRQPRPAQSRQQPRHPGPHRGLRHPQGHRRRIQRPHRRHRGHVRLTTKPPPRTPRPRRNPAGGAFPRTHVLTTNGAAIIALNVRAHGPASARGS
jgi:hypothetical protein